MSGSGFFVTPDLLLMSAHQNTRIVGEIPAASLFSPGLVPALILSGSYPRFSEWQATQFVGLGTRSTRVEHFEERSFRLEGGFSGVVDVGWTLLRVSPPYQGEIIRYDPVRDLPVGQEVFIVRPVLWDFPDGDGAAEALKVDAADLGPYLEASRSWIRQVGSDRGAFDSWRGRIVQPPSIEGLDLKHPWMERAGFIRFSMSTYLGGASGGPVLVRDGDSWVAVGLYSSVIRLDNQWLSEWQYGVFVRPKVSWKSVD